MVLNNTLKIFLTVIGLIFGPGAPLMHATAPDQPKKIHYAAGEDVTTFKTWLEKNSPSYNDLEEQLRTFIGFLRPKHGSAPAGTPSFTEHIAALLEHEPKLVTVATSEISELFKNKRECNIFEDDNDSLELQMTLVCMAAHEGDGSLMHLAANVPNGYRFIDLATKAGGKDGRSALQVAAEQSIDIWNTFWKTGAQLVEQTEKPAWYEHVLKTALFLQEEPRHTLQFLKSLTPREQKQLLFKGEKCRPFNDQHESALHIAARNKNMRDVVQYLIRNYPHMQLCLNKRGEKPATVAHKDLKHLFQPKQRSFLNNLWRSTKRIFSGW